MSIWPFSLSPCAGPIPCWNKVEPLAGAVLPQFLKAQPFGFVAAQDRRDDVRREAGQAEHSVFALRLRRDKPTDVGVVAVRLRLAASTRQAASSCQVVARVGVDSGRKKLRALWRLSGVPTADLSPAVRRA